MVQHAPEQKLVLSLDIGYQNVKALVTEAQAENIFCHHAAVLEIPRSEGNTSLGDFIEVLKTQLAPWKFDTRHVRVSLSGDSVTVRFIQVPNITKPQLLANISYESSKYIPFPLKDTYFDCDVFPPHGGTQEKTTAVIAAAKRDAVADVAKILHGMGFSAELLDVSPVAMFNAFEALGNGAAEKGSTFAILDVGSKKSHLCIIQEDTPAFARDLDVGSAAMPEETFRPLADAIGDSLRFFEAQHGPTSTGIYAAGGGAMMDGLASHLQQMLDIPIWLWNPFENPKIVLAEDVAACKPLGPIFAVCLGLATRNGVPA